MKSDSWTAGLERNRLLSRLPDTELAALESHAEYVTLPAGTTLTRPGEHLDSVYYPTSGVVSVVSTSRTGHLCQVAAVGAEGLIGIGIILNMQPSPFWYVVLVDTAGYRMPESAFLESFENLPGLRREILDYAGRILRRTGYAAMCNRFHSQDQRLAGWLLDLVRKSGRRTFELTHDDISQMIGGPRHAVTAALGNLRDAGIVEHRRGHVAVIDPDRLASYTCDCFTAEDK